MAITGADLIAHMGITQNLGPAEEIAAAVTDYINHLPSTERAFKVLYPEVTAPNPDVDDYSLAWGPRQTTAALMLGARWYRRRNSPNGIESSVGDAVVYVTKYDSDVARLLEIDGFEKPDVG